MLDAFVDDTASTRVELNTDQRQRGVITFKGGSQRDDEVANPNQYISKETKLNDEFKNVVSRTWAVPISLSYDIMIKLDTEMEALTCYTKILDMLYNYRFYNISYFGIKIALFDSLTRPFQQSFVLLNCRILLQDILVLYRFYKVQERMIYYQLCLSSFLQSHRDYLLFCLHLLLFHILLRIYQSKL